MIVENKNEQREIKSEDNLRILINNIEDPIWLVNTDCHIEECNDAFKRWVSYFIGEELAKGDHVLYNGRDRAYQEKFEMCYQLALQGRAFKSVENMNMGHETRYTSVSFHPVFENGNVIGVNCHARDITEQRQHLLKIEEQNAALKEIAFIESHKVRGPVATILGLEQLFNIDDYTDPFNKTIIDGIAKTTRDLDIIIRDVVRRSNEIDIEA